MKRLHVHAAIDDPRGDFAIPARSANPGSDHRGSQVETPAELPEAYFRAQRTDAHA